jgi:uncharacterized peroxidase-related enzyme
VKSPYRFNSNIELTVNLHFSRGFIMSNFPQHTIESAPEGSKATLIGAKNALGFVPNLYANLAESPTALNAYTTLAGIFEQSSLSITEQQVVLLTVSVYNNCEFCVSAHSVIAKHMLKVDADVVNSIRNDKPIQDKKLNALATFTRAIVDQRGWINDDSVNAFRAAGYSSQQALDVIVGVSLKTLSNYTNHLTGTRVNEQLAGEIWKSKR